MKLSKEEKKAKKQAKEEAKINKRIEFVVAETKRMLEKLLGGGENVR